jgi:predicted alpha-1,6-mannanase (GH76 family)
MKPKSTRKISMIQTVRLAGAVWLAVLSIMVIFSALTARAFTSTNADALFEAHTKAFYRMTNGGAFYLKNTEGNKPADFWTEAEQMEMVLDTYERTTNAQQLVMFTNLFHGFLAEHGRIWGRNPFNDDVMWTVIACTRAHLLTGNPEFLAVARANFDLCYARAASTNLGGGLWWKVGERTKNACVNGPGSIAAFLLGHATGNDRYFTISTNLFLWERATLFDPTTGKISDSIRANGRIADFALTYNQGTFVGAANFLGYTNEARLASLYTMNQMGRDGYLPGGSENGDGGGFAGIGVRWIARYMKDRGEQATFLPWLQKNAEAAWQARRTSDNLCNGFWPKPTPPGTRYSWGCSTAVVIMQVTPPTETVKPDEK